MAKTFETMKNNVGNYVNDTSSSLETLIGIWLNDKYRDISRRGVWSALVDDDYTFESVVGTATYSLPSDFQEEIAVFDIANGHSLMRDYEQSWWNERGNTYSSDSLDNGNPSRYVILWEASQIKLDPPPDTAETYAMPYKKTITELSSNSDTTLIKDIEWIMELGATAEALAYKRHLTKADYFFQKYEVELKRRIDQEWGRSNQVYQRKMGRDREPGLRRLTGDLSYDSI